MQRTIPSRALKIVAALLIAIIAVIGWLQTRWLAQLYDAEVSSRQAGLGQALDEFRRAFDRRYLSWRFSSQAAIDAIPRGGVGGPETLDDFQGTVIDRFLIEPLPDGDLRWSRFMNDGTIEALPAGPPRLDEGRDQTRRADRNPPDLETVIRSGWSDQIQPWPVSPSRLVSVIPASEDFSALVFSRFNAPEVPAFERSGQGLMMVAILARDGVDALIAELATQHFPNWPGGLDYVVTVTTKGEADEVVARSSDLAADQLIETSDGEIRLLMSSNIPDFASDLAIGDPDEECIDCDRVVDRLTFFAGSDDATTWTLRVRAREGSIAAAMARLRTRNQIVGVAGMALLAGSILLLLTLVSRAQRLAQARMDFVAGVSHELRTPLSVIGAAAANLSDGVVSEPAQVRDYGRLVHRETRRLRELVEKVLAVARLEEGRLETRPVAIGPIVERAVAALEPEIDEAGVEIAIDLPSDLPSIQANESALETALQNLVSNAVKYGRDGGRVQIEGRGAEGELRLTVKDWGPGIEADERRRLFEPFFRGRSARRRQLPGTGLGLSLVERIVAGHGGRVAVRSNPSDGASFDLFLPVADLESETDNLTTDSLATSGELAE